MRNIEQIVRRELADLLREEEKPVPELSSTLLLLDCGLDSLGFAVLVTRLEDELGYDPFTLMDHAVYPRTLGEFLTVYRDHAPRG